MLSKVLYLLGYAGSISTLTVIRIAGTVAAAVIISVRKVVTVILSFLCFAKQPTVLHLAAGFMFFSALLGHVLSAKSRKSKRE
jgi:drug/metabolite transporter (DMT)-like permease